MRRDGRLLCLASLAEWVLLNRALSVVCLEHVASGGIGKEVLNAYVMTFSAHFFML